MSELVLYNTRSECGRLFESTDLFLMKNIKMLTSITPYVVLFRQDLKSPSARLPFAESFPVIMQITIWAETKITEI